VAWRRIRQAGLDGCFHTLVGGDRVTHGKPDPEIYRIAAAEISVAPARCLAIEDSGPGIAAALAAGMTAICLVDLKPPPGELLARCSGVYNSARDLLPDLPDLVRAL
jgi:beta-phosphoglucomutase-like phosphatase (HAD superfamily)